MTKNERLKQARVKRGITQEELAVLMGVSTAYIGQLETKQTFGIKQARKLAEHLGVDPNWLFFGDPVEIPKTVPRIEATPFTILPGRDEFDGNDHKFAYSEEGVIAMRVKVVPAKAQLGYLRGFADPEYYESFDYEIIPVTQEHKAAYLGFETTGYSMVNLTSEQWAEKSIFPKRIAIGRELDRSKWRDKLHIHSNDAWVIVHKTDGILLKEIIKHDTNTAIITVHSWNPDKDQYPDEDFHLDDIAQLFNVLQVVDKRR